MKNVEKNFIALGILWSSSKEVSKEILYKMSMKYKINEIIFYDLKEMYKDFILGCYENDEDVMSDGYIDEKIKRLLEDGSGQVIAFSLEIRDPQYRFNKKIQCIQARELKEKIREEFRDKIENYFLDNIIHISDNQEETKWLNYLLNKYKKCIIKKYIRREEKSLVNEETSEKCKKLNQNER